MQGPRNCTSVLYVFIQDHLLGGSPGYCLATQYWQQSWQRPTGRLTGRLIAFSGPARGRKSGLSGFPTARFCAVAHEVSPLLITVGWLWEKTDPPWDLELTLRSTFRPVSEIMLKSVKSEKMVEFAIFFTLRKL